MTMGRIGYVLVRTVDKVVPETDGEKPWAWLIAGSPLWAGESKALFQETVKVTYKDLRGIQDDRYR